MCVCVCVIFYRPTEEVRAPLPPTRVNSGHFLWNPSCNRLNSAMQLTLIYQVSGISALYCQVNNFFPLL